MHLNDSAAVPYESVLPQTQLSKNVIAQMGGEGKSLYSTETWDLLIHTPEEKLHWAFKKMNATEWAQVWWKTRMIMEKWPDVKIRQIGLEKIVLI